MPGAVWTPALRHPRAARQTRAEPRRSRIAKRPRQRLVLDGRSGARTLEGEGLTVRAISSVRRARGSSVDRVSAEPLPVYPDPDDPAEILCALPQSLHDHFLGEYEQALERAREPRCYTALRDLLRFWRLHAIAIAQPEYADRAAAARRPGEDDVSLEDIVAARRGR